MNRGMAINKDKKLNMYIEPVEINVVEEMVE
jgi:hypothetical protein